MNSFIVHFPRSYILHIHYGKSVWPVDILVTAAASSRTCGLRNLCISNEQFLCLASGCVLRYVGRWRRCWLWWLMFVFARSWGTGEVSGWRGCQGLEKDDAEGRVFESKAQMLSWESAPLPAVLSYTEFSSSHSPAGISKQVVKNYAWLTKQPSEARRWEVK